jgi:hypothetical protein
MRWGGGEDGVLRLPDESKHGRLVIVACQERRHGGEIGFRSIAPPPGCQYSPCSRKIGLAAELPAARHPVRAERLVIPASNVFHASQLL